MESIRRFTSRSLVLPAANIDTDQIIPARFLTTTSFDGLGQHAFADWRYDAAGVALGDCELNDPGVASRQILVAGENFGCGSSREHAPWALVDFGFRAVISSRIADIFRANAPNAGLVPIVLDQADHAWLLAHSNTEITVDVVAGYVEFAAGHRAPFELEPFARHCLTNGLDPLGFLLERRGAIERFEASYR